jgi:hypothetical protein
MKKCVWIIVGWFIFLLPTCVIANDTIARIETGGITFVKSEDIQMAQEILEISTKSIRVQYVFQNESSKDIRATVAFPMPSYRWTSGEHADETNVKPLRPFSTKVNGNAVPNTIIKKATIKGVDVTSQLHKIGLNDKQIFETFSHCPDDDDDKKFELCGLSSKQKLSIEKLGEWEVSETAFWEQVFSGNKRIDVLHEYAPLVGQSGSSPYQKGFGYINDTVAGTILEACVDENFNRAIQKRIKSLVDHGAHNVSVSRQEVEYILGTGRNWKGPIADFTLRIRKESPDQLISLCFPGKPKHISDTVIEFSHKNFIPQDKLIIYFYGIYAY